MFKYSIDEYLASEQKKEADAALITIQKSWDIRLSTEIDRLLLDMKMTTYSSLEGITEISKKCKDPIVIAPVPRNIRDVFRAYKPVERGSLVVNRIQKGILPYTEFSLPSEFKCPYGYDFRNSFLLFVTKYPAYEAGRDCVMYFTKKFYNTKAFL